MSIVELDDSTYRVTCEQCGHFIRVDGESAENYYDNPESFKCELCYVQPGDPKPLLRTLHHCANCNQTFDSKTSCECPIEASSIKIVYDPDNKWMKKDWNKDVGSYNNKSMRTFNQNVRNRRVEAEERQVRVDKNLEKTVELLTKLVEKEKKDAV